MTEEEKVKMILEDFRMSDDGEMPIQICVPLKFNRYIKEYATRIDLIFSTQVNYERIIFTAGQIVYVFRYKSWPDTPVFRKNSAILDYSDANMQWPENREKQHKTRRSIQSKFRRTLKEHGVDKNIYTLQLAKQNYCCPFCWGVIKITFGELGGHIATIDHCSTTNINRAITHSQCNIAIGCLESCHTKSKDLNEYLRWCEENSIPEFKFARGNTDVLLTNAISKFVPGYLNYVPQQIHVSNLGLLAALKNSGEGE